MVKKFLKILLALVVIVVLYFGFWLAYGTIVDWKPAPLIEVGTSRAGQAIDSTFEFTFMTWNLGFAAQGAETAFFFDGGETVILEKELVDKNQSGIEQFVKDHPEVDFWLFQEIDSLAKRSHRINQVQRIGDLLPQHEHAFSLNFNHDFIPVPPLEPYGEVRSGLATYSRYAGHDYVRQGFSTEYEWPRRIFYLDRCFLSNRTPLSNGKELVILNTHCSAYDEEGSMVAQQIAEMVSFAKTEFEKGNYVVAGGDWNESPPGYESSSERHHILSNDQLPDGFTWVADLSTPTNRANGVVYEKGKTATSVIDQFFISPNLKVVLVKAFNQDFNYSDHQPVMLRIICITGK